MLTLLHIVLTWCWHSFDIMLSFILSCVDLIMWLCLWLGHTSLMFAEKYNKTEVASFLMADLERREQSVMRALRRDLCGALQCHISGIEKMYGFQSRSRPIPELSISRKRCRSPL